MFPIAVSAECKATFRGAILTHLGSNRILNRPEGQVRVLHFVPHKSMLTSRWFNLLVCGTFLLRRLSEGVTVFFSSCPAATVLFSPGDSEDHYSSITTAVTAAKAESVLVSRKCFRQGMDGSHEISFVSDELKTANGTITCRRQE